MDAIGWDPIDTWIDGMDLIGTDLGHPVGTQDLDARGPANIRTCTETWNVGSS